MELVLNKETGLIQPLCKIVLDYVDNNYYQDYTLSDPVKFNDDLAQSILGTIYKFIDFNIFVHSRYFNNTILFDISEPTIKVQKCTMHLQKETTNRFSNNIILKK